MANWVYNARQDLTEYPRLKESLVNIPAQISELEHQMTGIRSSTSYDKTPVQGGTSGYEDRIIDCIDRSERLKINHTIAAAKVERIERGLAALSKNERRTVEVLELNRTSNGFVRLCEELGYEKSQVYNIHNAALRSFTLAMFGVTDI